jgi:uncharacterized membrane protein
MSTRTNPGVSDGVISIVMTLLVLEIREIKFANFWKRSFPELGV